MKNSRVFRTTLFIVLLCVSFLTPLFVSRTHDIHAVLPLAASLSLAAGALFAVLLTRHTARPLHGILHTVRQIEGGGGLPEPDARPRGEHAILSHHLLQTHISRQRLSEQLAQSQLRLQEAQMLALQAQINPHFLYNTLEVIHSRAAQALGEGNDVSPMVATLSDLLRYALEKPGDPVPLSRELEHGRRYAELMGCRLGSSFSLAWDVPSDLHDHRVPKLILQPLIENAIQHGMQLAQTAVVITVSARVQGGVMTLIVSDNGAGMPESVLHALREQLASLDGLQYKHIGLFNVYQRMRLATQDQARMTVDSAEGGGTRVKLSIPVQAGGTVH